MLQCTPSTTIIKIKYKNKLLKVFNERMEKETVAHNYDGMLFSHKKRKILPFATTQHGLT
jgi:hypothetical protein